MEFNVANNNNHEQHNEQSKINERKMRNFVCIVWPTMLQL